MQYTIELERCILLGLISEWKEAVMILKPYERKKMRMPLFAIRDMKQKWGYWSKPKREISISRDLILYHPWNSVVEVLLHEIAHQYTDELLNASHEPPHGQSFQKACHLLRANPKASEGFNPLDERIASSNNNEENKILRQIQKLFCLAESKNRHEAEAAMAKAHTLIAKYNIDSLTKHESRDYVSICIGKPALRHTRVDYWLAHLLQDFYFVKGIWIRSFVLEKGKTGSVLEINGTIQNVQMAAYVYDFVKNFISVQWEQYNKNKGLNHYRMIDFAVGILKGFRSKVEEEKAEKKCTINNALIKINDQQLKEYVNYRYPYLRSVGGRSCYQDDKVVNDGKNIGKKLIISRGVTEKKGGIGYLSHY